MALADSNRPGCEAIDFRKGVADQAVVAKVLGGASFGELKSNCLR